MPSDERGARARVVCRAPEAPRANRSPSAPHVACAPRAIAPRAQLRTDTAHPARMYDYYLGGKDNFAADREAAENALAAAPELRAMARANRAFLRRAVAFAAASGVHQFLDVGTGLPTAGDPYDYSRADTRVVYADNDPMVLAHARALLARPGTATGVVAADLRDPEGLLRDPGLHDVLDLDRPVALILTAVVHYLADGDDPQGAVGTLMAGLAPGSLLVLSHATDDISPGSARSAAAAYAHLPTPMTLRSRPAIRALFDGLTPVSPGVVPTPYWRPSRTPRGGSDRVWMYAGVARKDDAAHGTADQFSAGASDTTRQSR